MQKLEITKNYSVEVPTGIKIYGFGENPQWCNSEDDDLISIVEMLKYRHPKIKDLLWHIPNESMMPVQGRVRAKRKGLKAGAPDLLIMTMPVIAIELKREGYKASFPNTKSRKHFDEQLKILKGLSDSGHTSVVAFGYKGFMDFYEKELKALLTEDGL